MDLPGPVPVPAFLATTLPSELVFDALDSPIAIIDAAGSIVAVNAAWDRAARTDSDQPWKCGVGVNYLSVCDSAVGDGSDEAAAVAAGIRDVLAGRADSYVGDYACRSSSEPRWFNLRVTPLPAGGAVLVHHDITALRLAEVGARVDDARLLRAFDESSPIFLLVDGDGTITYVSEQTCRLFGLESAQVVGTGIFSFVDLFDVDLAREVIEQVTAVPDGRQQLRCRAMDAAGRRREVEVTVVNLLDDPTVGALAISGSDVTDARLREIASRLEDRLLQRFPAAVVITDKAGAIAYWNERAEALTGIRADEAFGRLIDEVGLVSRHTQVDRRVARALRDHGRWEGEYEFVVPDGSVLPLHLSLEQVDDDEIDFHGLVGIAIDITERRRLQDELAFQALHDPLTGLPNRRRFVEQVEEAMQRAGSAPVAVAFLDLDDFKELNDRVGHVAGDEALRTIGNRLLGVLRADDVVARIGGDEFVVALLAVNGAGQALAVAERLLRAVRRPLVIERQRLQVSGSVGIAMAQSGVGAELLLRNADAAMYQAKEEGKNRIALFDDDLRDRTRSRRAFADRLRSAVAAGHIHARFQPQTCLRSGDLVGFEALARWHGDDAEFEDSASFLVVAEEGGVVADIDRLVLAESCGALGRFHAERPDLRCGISVNVSAELLADPAFPDLVAELLEANGVPAGLLCVEVVESALADAEGVARNLVRLEEMGVEVAIDDFGTGYSSLGRIQQFHVDYLKIDRTFVAGLGADHERDAVVVAIIGLARALGLRTVAEGVETDVQVGRLRDLGVDIGQGFHWSPAVAYDDAMAMVRSAPPADRSGRAPAG